jgi:Predicted acetamidase/formamidase
MLLLMKRISLLVPLWGPALAAQPSIAGDWQLSHRQLSSVAYFMLHIDQSGDQISGSFGPVKLTGTYRNSAIDAKSDEHGRKGTLTATVKGDEMQGGGEDEEGPFTFTARRVPGTTAAPKYHQFTPVAFHHYFSGSTPPALHINPGDTVETSSIDAGGVDETGKRRTSGGNPLTGPFYIDGVWPGDVIAVKLIRLRLNRNSAISRGTMSSTALDPGYFRTAKLDVNYDSDWKIDSGAGIARLARPTDRLKNFTVALKPMLGCIGVAPREEESFSSGSLGPYGGNMDYNQLGEGVTIYLPVFHPGALLYLGDAHAVQGDGELTGDALETSATFSFSVAVLKGGDILLGPRAENAQYRMASGIENSLPEALRQATTNLARWLEADYKLTANETAVVIGTSIHYDIAEVVDRQVHVVAKIEKIALARISP